MRTKVRSLTNEAHVGALAEALLPALLTRKMVLHRTWDTIFPKTIEEHIERSEFECVQDSFRVAELFIDERVRRLRIADARRQHQSALRLKRKLKKPRRS